MNDKRQNIDDWKNKIFSIPIMMVLISIFYSIVNYFLDCILDFNYAWDKPAYLFLYFIDFFIYRFWSLIPFMIIYFFLFKKYKPFSFSVLKFSFAILSTVIIENFFFSDDFSLYNGQYSKLKSQILYVSLGLFIVVIFEYSKSFKKN